MTLGKRSKFVSPFRKGCVWENIDVAERFRGKYKMEKGHVEVNSLVDGEIYLNMGKDSRGVEVDEEGDDTSDERDVDMKGKGKIALEVMRERSMYVVVAWSAPFKMEMKGAMIKMCLGGRLYGQ